MLDTTVPATPTAVLSDSNTNITTHTNQSLANLSITADTDAVAWCTFEQAQVTAAPAIPLFNDACWVTTRPTTRALGATGSRRTYVYTKDIAGNISAAAGIANIIYSTTPPVDPTLSLADTDSSSTTQTNSTTVDISITNDATATKWCVSETQNTPPANGVAACNGSKAGGSSWYTVEPISISLSTGDGSKTVYLWIVDIANNVNASAVTAAIVLDTAAPSVTGLSNDPTPTLNKTWTWGCSETPCTYRYTIDTTSNTSPTGAYGATVTDSQGTGSSTYYIHVQAKDAAGNESAVVHVSAILDHTGPIDATSLGWSVASPSSSTTVSASWTVSASSDLANQKIQFYSDGTCTNTTGSLISLNSAVTAAQSFTGAFGSTYSYKVTSIDTLLNSTTSTCSSAMVLGIIPSTPTALTFNANALIDQVALSWTASATGTSTITYTVLRGTVSGGPYAFTACSTTSTSCTDSAVVAGTQYYYVINATNVNGTSSNSSEITAIPMSAFTISSATGGNQEVAVSWGASTGATSYTLQYGTATGSYPIVWSTAATSTTTVTGLDNGTTYYFRIKAVNATGSGLSTSEASAAPIGPGNFQIMSVSATSTTATLSWSPAAGAASYAVLYGTVSGAYPTTDSANATSPHTVTGLTPGTTYYFMVTATASAVTINAKSEVNATTGTGWVLLGNPAGAAISTSATPGGFMAIDNSVSPSRIVVAGRGSVSTRAAAYQYSSAAWSLVGGADASSAATAAISVAVAPAGSPNAGYVYVGYNDPALSKMTIRVHDGSSWSTLGSAGFSALTPSATLVGVDSSGNVWAAYASAGDVYAMQWTGAAWSAETQISTNFSNLVNITFDTSVTPSLPYVLFHDTSAARPVVVKYSAGSWSTLAAFPSNSSQGGYVAVDSTGVPYATFQPNTNYKLTVVKYTAGAWATVGTTSFTPGVATSPKILFDSSDVPYVAYIDTSRLARLSVQKYSGGSWIPVGSLGFSEVPYSHVERFAIDSSDNLYVGVPLDNTAYSIYTFKASVDPGASALSWTNSYPSTIATLTASWVPSTDATINNQKIQIYSDDVCKTALGSLTDLASTTANTYDVAGTAGLTYSYRVITYYTAKDPVWSACAPSMTRSTNFIYATKARDFVGNAAAVGSYPSKIVLDQTNKPYMPFYDTSAAGSLTVKTLSGGIWSVVGTSGIVNSFWGAVALDSYGKIYAAGNNGTNSKTTVKEYSYSAGTWSTTGAATFTPSEAAGQKLLVDPVSNMPVVSFIDSTSSANKMSVMKFDGSNWNYVGNSQFTNALLATANAQSIAIDSAGTIYAASIEATTNSLVVMKYDGTSWVTVGGATLGTSTALGWVYMVIDPTTNYPVLTYLDSTASSGGTCLRFNGTSWGIVGTAGFVNGRVVVTVDSTGMPWAFANNGIVYKFTAGAWTALNTQSVATQSSTTAIGTLMSIAVDSTGLPWISYYDSLKLGAVVVKKWSP